MENNKNKCKIIINGKEEELCTYYDIEPKGDNETFIIKLKGLNNINDISYMFYGCLSLFSLPDIHNLNTFNFIDMSYLFGYCSSLSYISDISQWDINNVII